MKKLKKNNTDAKDFWQVNWFTIWVVTIIVCIMFSVLRSQLNSMNYEAEPTSTILSTETVLQVPPLPTIASTPTPTATAVPVTDNIPEPVYYDCRASAGWLCITPETDPLMAIAMTIYGEGGAVNLQLAVDMLQVLDNAMYNTWECWRYEDCSEEAQNINPMHRSYLETTLSERERLAMYMMSRPYSVSGSTNPKYPAKLYPAWNVWGKPMPFESVQSIPYQAKVWEALLYTVGTWIGSSQLEIIAYWGDKEFTPTPILRTNQDIIYFYGGIGEYDPYKARNSSLVYPFKVGTQQGYIYYSTKGLTQ